MVDVVEMNKKRFRELSERRSNLINQIGRTTVPQAKPALERELNEVTSSMNDFARSERLKQIRSNLSSVVFGKTASGRRARRSIRRFNRPVISRSILPKSKSLLINIPSPSKGKQMYFKNEEGIKEDIQQLLSEARRKNNLVFRS